jgi:quercetin dioxygenase-like cupin family protein
MMGVRVLRWDPGRDGELSEQAMRRKLEQLGYSVSRYVYPPSTFFGSHSHAIDKIDGVVSGRFRVRLAGEGVVLGPGDAVELPAGVQHEAEVIGDEAVVSLDGVRA